VFDEEHRVVVADGRLEHPLGVVGGAGHGHVQAGEVGEDHFWGVGVRRAKLLAAAGRRADDQRDGKLPVEHVADFGRVVDDGVHGQEGEVDRHDLGDRAQAGHGRADRRAGDGHLRDRRVAHAPGTELVEEAARHGVGAAPHADFFAHDEHALVALHLFAQGAAQRLAISDRSIGHGFL